MKLILIHTYESEDGGNDMVSLKSRQNFHASSSVLYLNAYERPTRSLVINVRSQAAARGRYLPLEARLIAIPGTKKTTQTATPRIADRLQRAGRIVVGNICM